jgi:lysophospholipase L1-like esterase
MKKLAVILFATAATIAAQCNVSSASCVGCIGDSISNGYKSNPGLNVCSALATSLSSVSGKTWGYNQQAANGTTTAGWVSGGALLNQALFYFGRSPAVTHVVIMLGTNDAKTTVATTQADYQSNLQGTINAIKAAGINKIMLSYSPYIDYTVNAGNGWDSTSDPRLLQYQTAIKNLVAADPTHVFLGDTQAYSWFQANPTQLADGVHPTGAPSNVGYTKLLSLWSQAFANNFLGPKTYLRASGPAAVQVVGVSASGSPMRITTRTSHGLNTGDTVVIAGVCSGSGSGASPANGIRIVTVTGTTTFTITETSGNAIVSNGAWCSGAANGSPAGIQWVGKVTPFTLGQQPLGILDGPNGNYMRKLSTGPQNGLTSLSVSGCSGSPASGCVITVATSYDPTAMQIPVGAGQSFSVVGTGSGSTRGPLDTCGAGGAEFGPYTVASASGAGWTSTPFTCNGLTNGTYTGVNLNCGPAATPNDTIGGTQDCVRVSLLAYTGNPLWDSLLTSAYGYYGLGSTTSYKFVFDGGTQYSSSIGLGGPTSPAEAAVMFLVDQSNSLLLNELTYFRDHFHNYGGVNWTGNESGSQVQPYFTADQGGPLAAAAWLYGVSSPYWTASTTQTFLDKIYNDVDDPNGTVCTKAHNNSADPSHTTVLATGTAQASGASSLTLSAGDTEGDGYYVNNVIQAANGKTCTVSGYVSATKLATCTASWGTTPPATTTYTIYASASVLTTAHPATTTVTGYNTLFTTTVHVGDGVQIGFNINDIGSSIMYVTAVNSDTSLTVVNGSGVGINTTAGVPSIVYMHPQWTTGDCGLVWLEKHSLGIYNSQPILYPQAGGDETLLNGTPATGGNFWIGTMIGNMEAGFAMAGADPRAVKALAIYQSAWFDFELSHYMGYGLGWDHSGASYAWGTIGGNMTGAILALTNSVPTFPSMDLANWAYHDSVQYKILTALPDIEDTGNGNGHKIMVAPWGTETAYPQMYMSNWFNAGYMTDPVFLYAPSSTNALYLKDWLVNKVPGFNMWGSNSINPAGRAGGLLVDDPRIGTSPHTVMPHQYLFQANSPAVCASLTGGVCDATLRGDAVISRTGLTNTNDTLLMYQSRSWWGDHDLPSNGELSIYKAGALLGADEASALPDAGISGSGQSDNSIHGNMLQFGGAGSAPGGNSWNPPQAGKSPITMWASANHGSWASQYGDQNSQYMFVCSNLGPAYTTVTIYAQRCIAHMKPSSGEEIIVQGDFASVPTTTQIAYHVPYPQNGDPRGNLAYYPEGTTVFDGTQVTELEDGGSDGNGNPARTYGLLTRFFSPGTITVRDDGSSYTGGYGHTHRISVCGGTACGANVSTYEVVTVHKIAQNLSDTTLTATALNPDTNWTGVQTADKVVLLARGGTTHSSIAGFTTTHPGTAQYLFGGLTPGVYTVTIGGNPVSGSPFTVSANDNSIEFVSPAGAVSVNGSVNVGVKTITPIEGQIGAGGSVIIY